MWLPTRATVTVGCVRSNCNFDGHPYHNYWAIDLLGHLGDPIYAATDGTASIIQRADPRHSCGPIGSSTPSNAVKVDHGDGVVTLYYHLSQILITNGQPVTPNMELGTMDSTGQLSHAPLTISTLR
jgi:murein DD-endopeptidase MepM/ murein hydrolase activator NlpD